MKSQDLGDDDDYVTVKYIKYLPRISREACQIRVVPRWIIPFVPAVMQLTRGFLLVALAEGL